jgi:hypothetical protein
VLRRQPGAKKEKVVKKGFMAQEDPHGCPKCGIIVLVVVAVITASFIGILVSAFSGSRRNFVSEPTPIPTTTPEASPRHENSVNQKFTKVPPDQLNEWLAACKERVVCITPLMHNVLNDLRIDSYLVVTEPKRKSE